MMSHHGTHWVERQDFDALTVVRLKPPKNPDEDVIRTVFDLIYKLISDVGRNQLIVNLAGVEFFPSMGLGKLVMLNRKIQAAKGRLALCHVGTDVHQALEQTRLLALFQVYPTEAEALQAFANSRGPETSSEMSEG